MSTFSPRGLSHPDPHGGGKEVILADMRAGEYFGELAAIDGIARSANVSALTRAEICIVSAGVFREMVAASRILSDKLLRCWPPGCGTSTFVFSSTRCSTFATGSMPSCCAFRCHGQCSAGARGLSAPVHHVLAARVGCRREQITRELGAMKTEGLMERTRGAMVLLDPDTLRQRIAQAMRDAG